MKIFHLTLLVLLASIRLLGQNTYQTFASDGFRIRCGCNLYTNSIFIQAAKKQGINNIKSAYICAENKDNPDLGVAVNINIYDESGSYANIKPTYYSFFEKKCLEQYALNLSKAGINYVYVTFHGVSALEYKFEQMGVPTKAVMFYKNKKSYLLQVATRNNLVTKYNDFKNSFEIL